MSERRCNECTLCCKLMPVAEIGKRWNTVCVHQRSKGCRIHASPSYPRACRLWSCAWLRDDALLLDRPDRAGYVIDPAPEFIIISGRKVPVIQIWVDPRSPNAHRDPALRAWLAAAWEKHGQLALVRFDSLVSIVLFPPSFVGEENCWIEAEGTASVEHSASEITESMQRLNAQDVGERRTSIEGMMRAAIKRP